MVSRFVRLALPLAAVLALPCGVFAQTVPTGPAASPAASQQPSYRPAVIQFDAKGLSLLDAVKMSLEHDPNVRLRDTDVERQAGVLREQAGYFDGIFRGRGDFQYVRSELRDSDKRTEQTRRDQLDTGILQGERLLGSLNPAISNLNDPRLAVNPASVDLTSGVSDQDVKTELSMIQSQLQLVNDLLARTTDANVRRDLTELRDKTIAAGLSRFNAARTETNAALSDAKRIRAQMGDTPQDQWDQNLNVRMDFSKPLRSGLFLQPFATLNNTGANYVGKNSWDPEWGGLGVKDYYRGEMGFDLTVPLLRGRGGSDVAAGEMAAARDLEAARLNLLHEKSRTVLNTVLAYWEARAAAEQVEVAKRSVEMETRLADLIRKLVGAKERARTDETRVTASLADAQARLEGAQRQAVEARINLARVMGVALADAQAIPLAADPFPLPSAFTPTATALAELARDAVALRADLQAAGAREEAGKIISLGAQLQTRRSLNVNLSGWGNTTAEDSPKFGRWVFRSGRAGLDFEIPFGNDQAMGRYAQAVASLHQSEITTTDTSRVIRLNIYRSAESLRLAGQRVTWAQEAAINYDRTILDEEARLKLGDATLVDVILTEQQTTAARIALIQAQQDYASLLARLRFESGSLVRDAAGAVTVALENLLTVPPQLRGAGGVR